MKFNIQQMVEVSIFVALAFILDAVSKVYSGWFWAYGGSISLSLVAIAILAYRHGWKIGVLSGALVGVIQLLFGAYYLHPIQVLFDYPLPFAALGMSGIWSKKIHTNIRSTQIYYIWLSTGIASLLRLCCHVISGYVFFASYTPAGMNPFWYSVVYNFPYVMLSWIVSAMLLSILSKKHQSILYV